MTDDNYSKAYKEVLEILKFIPVEDVNKIPADMIEMFKTKQDNSHTFTVNISKSFEEQNIMQETKAILANIFRDYWATPYQKERIIAKENYDNKKAEDERRIQYNPDALFSRKNSSNNNIINSNLPIEVKKENFYTKLINFIKKFLHI